MVEVFENEKNFFDEDFRAEIRDHARAYFEKIIQENVVIFKQDLDAVSAEISADLKTRTAQQLETSIAHLNIELKDHVVKQLDGQFAEYSAAAKVAQDKLLDSLSHSAEDLEEQHKQLSLTLHKSIANQSIMLQNSFDENIATMTALKEANKTALQSLEQSVEELKEQNEQLTATLEKKIATQEDVVIKAFEGNMAQVIEHYLLGALSEQYDLKEQLPAIIQQMEANKQALVDDMKL